MLRKLSILLTLTLAGCSQPAERAKVTAQTQAATVSVPIPVGFSVIEQQPDGYFIQLASAERADKATIRILAVTFYGKFDRVDLCLNGAHGRGDEYTSIIGYQVFDHENDNIYTLNTISK